MPVVLSPVTLNNYGGNCNFQYPLWVRAVSNPDNRARPAGRAYQRYLEMKEFQNSKDRPYIHLVDGGVSDNIGVRGVLEFLEEAAASAAFQGEVGFGAIKRIILLVVNSHSSPKTDWDREETPPGMAVQLMQASGVPIDRFSFETVETMKDRAEIMSWRRELLVAKARLAGATEAEAEKSVPKVTLEVVDVSFDAIKEAEGACLLHEPADQLRAPSGRRRPLARRRGRVAASVRRLPEGPPRLRQSRCRVGQS